jgi:hypothetical protein
MSTLPTTYWVYLTALALGALSGSLALFGASESEAPTHAEPDAHADADGHADGDAGVDGEGDGDDDLVAAWLSAFGVGRMPLGLLLTVDLLAFGALGVVASELLRSVLSLATASLVGLPVALVLAPLAGARIARAVGRRLPSVESHGVSRAGLIGRLGRAELPIDGAFGRARIVDDGGALHQVRCITRGECIARGEELVVTDFDADRASYIVECADFLRR